jgi:hypothetical protein
VLSVKGDVMDITPAPSAEALRRAFWEAMKRCGDDDRVHDMEYPWHDDPKIDGDIPDVLWGHMQTVLGEPREHHYPCFPDGLTLTQQTIITGGKPDTDAP